MKSAHPLWNRHLLLLYAITFLAYSNISVFFQFYEYLRTLPIDPGWFGLLIGAFSAVSLVVRPLVIPFVHAGNARALIYLGAFLVALTLCAYSLARGLAGMLIVRSLHGISFVVMGSALLTLMIDHIPKDRSAQLFGLIGILILLPNTMVPPVLPYLSGLLGGYTNALIFFAAITMLSIPFARAVGSPGVGQETSRPPGRPSRQEILENIANPAVFVLLSAMLLFYCSQALVFFFLDGFGRSIGIEKTGLFLTLATAGEIGVRAGAGSRFDRMDKLQVSVLVTAGLALAYAFLGHVTGGVAFFAAGLICGLGWGVAMPVFSALMFDMSPAEFKAFNTNLGMQSFQAGYFLGPFVGAPVAAHWGFTRLFHLCGLMSLMSSALTYYLARRMRRISPSRP